MKNEKDNTEVGSDALLAALLEKHELQKTDVIELGYRSKRGRLTSMDERILRKVQRDIMEVKKWIPARKAWFDLSDIGRRRAVAEVNPFSG